MIDSQIVSFSPASFEKLAVVIKTRLGLVKTFYLKPEKISGIAPGDDARIEAGGFIWRGTVEAIYPVRIDKQDGGHNDGPSPKGAA